jgi:hypothetical protein
MNVARHFQFPLHYIQILSLINTIKDELPMTFVSFRIIVYLAILGVNLPGRIENLGEVHLQVHYKPNVT